jgi:predicted transcriptional regulator
VANTDKDSSYNTIFLELGSELRSSIFSILNEKSLKLSQLANEVGITVQEAHRHAERLIEAGLIRKNSDSLLSITTYGKAMMKQISSFKFLAEHKQYFEEHSLDDLPMQFIQRVGALSNGQLVNGVVAILERWEDMCNEANKYIREVMAQVPLELIQMHADRIKHGTKFFYIVGENTTIPKRSAELLKRVNWQDFVSKGIAERRMIEKVQVMVIITEDQAAVSFPNIKGDPDTNSMFFSKDPIFHEWCLDFFTYTWNNSYEFDKTKIHAV